MVNHVNRWRKQEATEKSLILPIFRADERTTKCYDASVAAVEQTEE
jgi:hypothetical protein